MMLSAPSEDEVCPGDQQRRVVASDGNGVEGGGRCTYLDCKAYRVYWLGEEQQSYGCRGARHRVKGLGSLRARQR